MAEQTFRSPGYVDREIDLTARRVEPTGVPAGVIGTSNKGPAFVPITVGSFADFRTKFGDLDPKKFGPYAVNEFLKHRQALTYLRVLGAGANETLSDISRTLNTGRVKNAGFVVTGSVIETVGRHAGAVQMLVARHKLTAIETIGFPMFSDNDSYTGDSNGETVNLVRAVLFTANTARIRIQNGDTPVTVDHVLTGSDHAGVTSATGVFKFIVSSSWGASFANDDGIAGIKVFSASLNPSSASYIGNILNTDPDKFLEEQHLLYLDFAVDDEIASVDPVATTAIAITSGSTNASSDSGDTSLIFRNAFGHFDTRYTTPKTTSFISQPFGGAEYELFNFECLDDGDYSNTRIKVSIANLQMSIDPAYEYGTFAVQVRSYDDTDQDPKVLEVFPLCSLDPKSERFIAKVIGDKKARFNFDADQEDERRLITTGKYDNLSNYIRVVVSDAVEKALIPAKALPFGFKGIPALKTTVAGNDAGDGTRLTFVADTALLVSSSVSNLSSSIIPPLPFRFKTTRGNIESSPSAGALAGLPGTRELADSRLYWGIKFERNSTPLNSNTTGLKNSCVNSYTKFMGIAKLDILTSGSTVDTTNNNKFTLARVAFGTTANNTAFASGTVDEVMREAAYIRDGKYATSNYTVNDGVASRITLATLAAQTSSVDFNRFVSYTKFTNIFYGGFDGVNKLDRNASRLNDKSTATSGIEAGAVSTTTGAFATNIAGTGRENNSVASYIAAAKIMTDPLITRINIFAAPGIREPLITDQTLSLVKSNGQMLCVVDLEERDDTNARIFDDSTVKPDVRNTRETFDSRAIDNNYGATYFPNIIIDDEINRRRVEVPASIACIAALAYNDKVSYPWFAPAGFNRGALDFVKGVDVRLTADDKNTLYESRINPIASFPGTSAPVIFGQKTLQQANTSLNRVNVRRLMVEIKRIVSQAALRLTFEQANQTTRDRFVSQVAPSLAIIQTQAGIEKFKVVCDSTNNTAADVDANRINGRVVVVPTRAVENIAIDFIVTAAGVQFI